MSEANLIPASWQAVSGYEFKELRYAGLVIDTDYQEVVDEVRDILDAFTIRRTDVLAGGGGKTVMVKWLEGRFNEFGWHKRNFDVNISVDGIARQSLTHEIDHVRALDDDRHPIALEIEWNNKDPFFDRDLQNFRSLHDVGAISAGIILTRGPGMQDALAATYMDAYERKPEEDIKSIITAWKSASQREQLRNMSLEDAASWLANKAFQSKYGQATTHWSKLMDRIDRGLGDPCPLILIGVTDKRLVD